MTHAQLARRTSASVMGAMLMVMAMMLMTTAPAQAAPKLAYDVPVTGTVNDVAATGTFTITGIRRDGDGLVADGLLTLPGTSVTEQPITREITNISTASNDVTAQQTTGECEILRLTLGPLNLDLLGLQIFLDTVVLEIAADRGPGNLLGNLLCAVAGLLDNTGGGGALSGIANLLNQILGILQGL